MQSLYREFLHLIRDIGLANFEVYKTLNVSLFF